MLSESTQDTIVNAAIDIFGWVSIHVGDPGPDGDNEATGDTYERMPITWPNPGGGSSTTDPISVPVDAGDYSHFGIWSAPTGGTFRGGDVLVPPVSMSVSGTIDINLTAVATNPS